jgi:serine/threonine protein kinase
MSEVAVPADAGLESLVAQVADEFLDRQKRGERPTAAEYADRHPEAAGLLREVLAALEVAGLSAAGATAAAAEADVGGTLGDYRIVREVGRGGMGVVYEAVQVSLRRRVALKVLPFAAAMDRTRLQRFQNEALAAASLKHDHIVAVYAVGCERGVHYYAMEFIDGLTLAAVISGRAGGVTPSVTAPLPGANQDREVDTPPAPDTAPVAALTTERGPKGRAFYRTAAQLIAQAADALEHAHSLGVVHRDIKPANLLMDAADKLYVSDFGLARFGADANLTLSGDLLGTLRYMAPEQALAKHGLVDHRADVYGLGATLYELLTLRPAVGGEDKQEVLRRIAFEEPAPPRKLDKAIPAELETIALKCLAKIPTERYATAGDLADDLRRWLADQTIKAKPPTLRQKAVKWARRHSGAVAAVMAGLVLATVAAAASAVFVYREKQNAQDAYARARLALDELSSEVIDDWLSRQPQLSQKQREFLKRALDSYERLAARAGGDEQSRAGVAAAHQRVGDIRIRLGDMREAEAACGRSVTLYERLAAAAPSVPAYRQALAKSCNSLGFVLRVTGRPAEAEAAYRRALALRDELLTAAPGPGARGELAETLHDYGLLLSGTGRRAEAEPMNRRGLDLLRDSAAGQSDRPADRHRLAQFSINLGDILYHTGRKPEAEPCYRQGMALLEELEAQAVDGSEAARYREDLANALTGLGHLLGAWSLGRPTEAVEVDRRAVAVRERLVADYPAVPAYRHRLAESLSGLGNHLWDLRRESEMEPQYRRAQALWERLAADFPAEPRYRESLAEVFLRWGMNVGSHRPAEAERAFGRAVELRERLTADYPAEPDFRYGLAQTLEIYANFLGKRGRLPEAECEFRRGLALLDRLVADFPTQSRYRDRLAESSMCMGICYRDAGRMTEAELAFRQAVAVRERLVADFPAASVFRFSLARFVGMLGDLFWALGRRPEALTYFEQQRAQFDHLAKHHLVPPQFRDQFIGMWLDRGNLYRRSGRPADAEQAYRQAVALLTKWAADSPPDDFRVRPRLHDALLILADVVRDQGRPADARAVLEQDRQNLRAALQAAPARPADEGTQADAFGLRYQYADLLMRLGPDAVATEEVRAALRDMDRIAERPQEWNSLAWLLATCRDPRFRDPRRAVEFARKAVEEFPNVSRFWNTLGVAHYRAGNVLDAVAALEESMRLGNGGNEWDWFFLAMAYRQLGDPYRPLLFYLAAVRRMEIHRPPNDELRRFRAEAAELLGIPAGLQDG